MSAPRDLRINQPISFSFPRSSLNLSDLLLLELADGLSDMSDIVREICFCEVKVFSRCY